MKTLKFPEGFYWGAATASYQVEGGIENTDWSKAATEGRVPVAGELADHYHRFEQDFDIAKMLGHNSHRISIEWARVEPREGEYDDKEIEHYRNVLRALRDRGLEPFVTLWHFTLPLWFSEKGGFENKDAPKIFARYCAHITEKLDGLCTHYATINEPMVYVSNGFLRGTWPPFKRWSPIHAVSITNSGRKHMARPTKSLFNIVKYFTVANNLARAHNAAYDAIKKVRLDADVSIVTHVILFHANGNPFNKMLAWITNWNWTHRFMKRVYKKCDSISMNYYIHKKFGDTQKYPKTDMDWDVYPQGIEPALHMLARYGKPLLVSEAGVADAKDTIRAQYIKDQVAAIHRAIESGLDVRGHMYWSLLDNYEWALGTDKRFGLVEIDYATKARTVRPSAYEYKKICESNSLILTP